MLRDTPSLVSTAYLAALLVGFRIVQFSYESSDVNPMERVVDHVRSRIRPAYSPTVTG